MKVTLFYPSFLPILVTICAIGCVGISLVQAQPDANYSSIAVNPVNQTAGPNKMRIERTNQEFRRRLEVLGLNQVTAQETILAYVENESAHRTQIIKEAKELGALLLGTNNGIQTDAQLKKYREMVDEDKTRQAKARAALAEAVNLARYPKVEAMLNLMGVYGEGPTIFGGVEDFVRGKDAAEGVAATLRTDRSKAALKGRTGINMNKYGK